VSDQLPWEDVATSETYRAASPYDRSQIQKAWIAQVGPFFFGSDVTTNPLKYRSLLQYTRSIELPPKTPDEDEIIKPGSERMTGLQTIESNPLFERKSYGEQQSLRQIWFTKMAALDPEYRSLSPAQQQTFYQSIMQRAPALQNKLGMPGASKGQPPGQLINTGYYDIEETTKEFLARSKGEQQAEAYIRSSAYAFAESVGGWIAGPIRWLADKTLGEHNPLSSIFEDLAKYKEWQLSVSQADNPLPEMAAGFAGFLVPGNLFGKVARGLAGEWKTTQLLGKTLPLISSTGKLIPEAGLLERIGSLSKVGQKIPSAIYQIAGGTTAGALVGIGSNMLEGQEPLATLPQDLLLGIGLESVGRFWAARSLMKNHLKAVGFTGSTKDYFSKPLDVTAGQSLDADFARTFFAHPIGKYLNRISEEATKTGFPLHDYYVPENVKMRADIIGLRVAEEGNTVRIFKGDTLQQTLEHPDASVRWTQASEYLDQQDTAWERVLGKPFEEQAQMLPGVKMIHGIPLTDKSRQVVLDEINKKNLNILGANFKLDPAADDTKVAAIFKTIMTHDTKKAVGILERLGVDIRADLAPEDVAADFVKKKEAVVATVRAELEQTLPEAEFFFVNTRTKKILKPNEIPQIVFERPNTLGVSILNGTYSMQMDNVRKTLLDLKKAGISMKSRVTRIAKTRRMAVTRNMDDRVVQLQIEVPNAAGVFHPVTLHFNSELRALQFMRGEGKQEMKNLFRNDPEMMESFDQFRKTFRKTNRREYESSFLPFRYLAEEARQKSFFLGGYKGKYVLHDRLSREGTAKYTEFDNLYDLASFLKKQDPSEVLPDLTGIPQDAVERLYPNGIDHPFVKDPLRTLPEKPIKEKQFNILNRISMFWKPTQAMLDDFNRMPFAKPLREAGMDPVSMGNTLTRSMMADHTWMTSRLDFLSKELRGFKKEEDIVLTRYMEARYEGRPLEENGITFESKKDVETDMVQQFGAERASAIVATSTRLRKLLDQVFSEAGLDPAIYLDDYMPHLLSEARRNSRNMSGSLNLEEATSWLPSTKRKEFMEFLREVDISDAALERRASRLTETYLRAASRKMFITPTLDAIKNVINGVSKEHWKTIKPTEAIAFIDYMRNIFRTIYGSKTASEIVTARAGQNTIYRLARTFKKDITINKLNLVDKLTTLSTLGYIGARPYSVFKQLVSMATVGGPYIGMPWLLEGINRLANPGELQRLARAGVVSSVLPTGAEFAMEGFGKVTKKIAEVSMAPFKWGDDVARAAVYLGMEQRLLTSIKRLRTGQIDINHFYTESGMNLFGAGQYDYGKKLLDANPGTTGDLAFVDHFSKLAADRTAFLYDRFQRPQLVRSSVGKFFGQFGTWPLNFLALVKDRMSCDTLTIPQKIKVLAELTAATYAVAEGFKAVGVSDPSWYPWNQVTFQGGPYYSMMNNLLNAIGGDQQAYNAFAGEITNLIPYAREGTSIFRAVDSLGKGDAWKAFLYLCSAPVQLEPYEQKVNLPLLNSVKDALTAGGAQLFATKAALEK